jgi:hypothetical protein
MGHVPTLLLPPSSLAHQDEGAYANVLLWCPTGLKRVSFYDQQHLSTVKVSLLLQGQYRAKAYREKLRLQSFPKKEQLHLPQPGGIPWHMPTTYAEMVKWNESGWSKAVNKFLSKLALRTLNEAWDAHEKDEGAPLTFVQMQNRLTHGHVHPVSVEELSYILFQECLEGGYGDNDGVRAKHKADAMFTRCEQQAAFALKKWDPMFMVKLRKAGSRGGTVSKPPRVFTKDMLDPLLGKSKKEQMAALGCSKSMIEKLRREHDYYRKEA